MAELSYHDLGSHLASANRPGAPAWPPVLLIYGEEMLVQQALHKVRDAILGEGAHGVAYEAVDGLNENVAEALARVNTYGLLSSTKVVALTDARLFHSRQTADRLWAQAARAGLAGNLKKAARYFLDILSLQNLTLNDVRGGALEEALRPPQGLDDLTWLATVRDHCQQQGLSVPAAADPQQLLQDAILSGFPPGQHLVITTELVDKRRALYKCIRENGLLVDCSVPKGDRQADRQAQATVLDATVDDVLAGSGKRMAPAARRALYDLTGFDLRTVAASVEKLIHFTGNRQHIEAEDVRQTLERTRRDPLYAFTEAVAGRQLNPSLFYLDSLLSGGDFDHPLPLLAAVANQVRRLLVARDFLDSSDGRVWRPGCSFPHFQSQVMPAVTAFDQTLQAVMGAWEETLREEDALAAPKGTSGTKAGQKKAKAAARSDLLMAGRSPYPVYKTLQKAEHFTRAELIATMQAISAADRRLKRSGASGRLVLEALILTICIKIPEAQSPARPETARSGARPPHLERTAARAARHSR